MYLCGMKYGYFLLLILLVSCGRVSKDDLAKVNGYWEIESAVMADGTKRDYTINETIDYIEIKGDKGFRKKLMPQFDGKYIDAGNPQEDFSVESKDDKILFHYKTDYAKWSEEILEIGTDELTVKNDAGLTFKYKRYKPLDLE